MPWWFKNQNNLYSSVARLQGLFARLLTLSIPSMCVLRGHVYAGGLMIALCHDFRIALVPDKKARYCLAEINVGRNLPTIMGELLKLLLPI